MAGRRMNWHFRFSWSGWRFFAALTVWGLAWTLSLVSGLATPDPGSLALSLVAVLAFAAHVEVAG